eukprot:gb/GEZJ01004325.1/.p1 GENE.gb/GEZJ01004325.1/~~gb/GEZJ01004325.1/.p1  ORF type:complete len:102 (+),score=8.96 gb/GEZJ01004325.1/:1335-1640(+)
MSYFHIFLGHLLNTAWKQATIEFFNNAGYLLVKWSPYEQCKMRHAEVTMSCVARADVAPAPSPENNPSTVLISVNDPNLLFPNESHYKKFVSSRPERMLMV